MRANEEFFLNKHEELWPVAPPGTGSANNARNTDRALRRAGAFLQAILEVGPGSGQGRRGLPDVGGRASQPKPIGLIWGQQQGLPQPSRAPQGFKHMLRRQIGVPVVDVAA